MARLLGLGVCLPLCLFLTTPAYAHGPIIGQTYTHDGSFVTRGPAAGTRISVYATHAAPNTLHHLKAALVESSSYSCLHGTQVHPSGRWSSSRGLIPVTTAVITGVRGEYQICFVNAQTDGGNVYVTDPVFLALL